MPGFDRTGPKGQGAMTGRKLGKCSKKSENPDSSAQEERILQRRGMGRGQGAGQGFHRGRNAENQ